VYTWFIERRTDSVHTEGAFRRQNPGRRKRQPGVLFLLLTAFHTSGSVMATEFNLWPLTTLRGARPVPIVPDLFRCFCGGPFSFAQKPLEVHLVVKHPRPGDSPAPNPIVAIALSALADDYLKRITEEAQTGLEATANG